MEEIQGPSLSSGTSTGTLRGGRSYAYGRTEDMPRQTDLGHEIRQSGARQAEADYQRAIHEQREQLAGYLVGENTRTDGALGAMLTVYGNGGAIAEKVLGRVYSPKRTVKQYLGWQDHFRRIGKNQLMKEPGSKTAQFKPRISSRTFEAQPYGLHAVMTAEDIAEADAGVQVREQNAFALRHILDLELEYQFFDFATTAANYATGHTAAVSNWDNDLVATIRRNFHTAHGVIKTDTGGAPTGNSECVAFGGYDVFISILESAEVVSRFNATNSTAGARGGEPDGEFLKQFLRVDRIEVSEMAAGPAQETTTTPLSTSNAFVWPSTTDTFCCWHQSRSISSTGVTPLGEWTTAAMFGRFGRTYQSWTGDDETSDQSGPVEFVQALDEWVISPVAINNTTDADMTGGYAFTDCLA